MKRRVTGKASKSGRVGDFASLVRVVKSAAGAPALTDVAARRRLLADLCKLLGGRMTAPAEPVAPAVAGPKPAEVAGLSPREQEVLARLLAGDSEKEAAARLGLSQNTVHTYVKRVYAHFSVRSRGALLAKWVRS